MAGRKKGTPKTGGRKKNTLNKVTADIKAIAQPYGTEAVETLVIIMRGTNQPPAARVAAAKEVLDRGYGKSIQTTDLQNSDGSLRHPGYAVTPDRAKTMESWTQNVASQTPKDA